MRSVVWCGVDMMAWENREDEDEDTRYPEVRDME